LGLTRPVLTPRTAQHEEDRPGIVPRGQIVSPEATALPYSTAAPFPSGLTRHLPRSGPL